MSSHFLNKAKKTLQKWLSQKYDESDLDVHGGLVHVIHSDGTSHTFINAFALKWDEPHNLHGGSTKVLGVVSEHNGIHVFSCGDLYRYWQFEGSKISTLNRDEL